MKKNKNLAQARKAKNDEFYTHYEDIEKEITNYREQFKGKKVLLNCDDYRMSKFYTYFKENFKELGLVKLVTTHKEEQDFVCSTIFMNGQENIYTYKDKESGFNSPLSIALLEDCDIVVSNPPFSLFRDYVDLLERYNKQYLIIGSQNAFTYKNVFSLLRDRKMWTGYNMVKSFTKPNGEIQKFGNICWFTNIKTGKLNKEVALVETYNDIDYPHYDNLYAINVNKVKDIPKDYFGLMGVPITFINKHNPNQFTIVGISSFEEFPQTIVNGKKTYRRIIIKRSVIF